MQASVLCREIIDALDKFDQELAPLGLYAIDDVKSKFRRPRILRNVSVYAEWNNCLAPMLRNLGCSGVEDFLESGAKTLFDVPEIGFTQLQIARISQIKVSKFGESYQTDKHRNYRDRWEETALEKRLSQLWNEEDSTIALRLFLFIGFDKTPTPFGGDLAKLQENTNWDARNIEYQTRFWRDRSARNFSIRLCLWARDAASSTR